MDRSSSRRMISCVLAPEGKLQPVGRLPDSAKFIVLSPSALSLLILVSVSEALGAFAGIAKVVPKMV